MSDRVARLAEIRRKRKIQEQNQGVENVVLEKPNEEPIIAHVTTTREEETAEKRGEERVKEKELENSQHDTAAEESVALESEPSVEKLTYNSDLKRDLAPYLKQAKMETERALNKILQEKYQEATKTNTEGI